MDTPLAHLAAPMLNQRPDDQAQQQPVNLEALPPHE
jgi:hypothetical protein